MKPCKISTLRNEQVKFQGCVFSGDLMSDTVADKNFKQCIFEENEFSLVTFENCTFEDVIFYQVTGYYVIRNSPAPALEIITGKLWWNEQYIHHKKKEWSKHS